MASKLEMALAAAKEINTALNMDPKILEKAKKVEEVIASMKEELGGEIYTSDKAKLSEDTWKFVTEIAKLKVVEDPAAAEEEEEAKPAKKDKAAKEKPAKAAKATKEPKEKKAPPKKSGPNRIQAAVAIFKKKGAEVNDATIEAMDKWYVDNGGGKSNVKEQATVARMTLVAWNAIKADD